MSNKENESNKFLDSTDEIRNNNTKIIKDENNLEAYSNNMQLIDEKQITNEDQYIKYITQIEQLQNELQLEKSITNSIKNFGVGMEELVKLKSELQDKEQKLLQLKQINQKQEEVLIDLRKKYQKNVIKIRTHIHIKIIEVKTCQKMMKMIKMMQ